MTGKHFKALAFAATLMISSAPAWAAAEIDLIQHYSPVRAPDFYISPSFPAYQDNVIAGLIAGGVATGPLNSPTRFQPFDKTLFSLEETFGTPFNSWLGDTTPEGAFSGEFGTYVRAALRITSDTPFLLSQVTGSYRDNFGSDFTYTLGEFGSFAPDFVGLTASGDFLDSENDDFNQSIVGLFFVGDAFFNSFLSPQDVEDIGLPPEEIFPFLNGVLAGQPYEFDLRYSLNEGGTVVASDQFVGLVVAAAAVPEPGTWALMIGGFGMVGGMIRRQRRRDSKDSLQSLATT